ncbi:MAG: hypothetical protein DMG32_19635 [Acidobacteria bacterium]|nr:MAG: hypothetical protein DMG32_19635 [Acidobacteriota bacterium]
MSKNKKEEITFAADQLTGPFVTPVVKYGPPMPREPEMCPGQSPFVIVDTARLTQETRPVKPVAPAEHSDQLTCWAKTEQPRRLPRAVSSLSDPEDTREFTNRFGDKEGRGKGK